MSVIYGITSGGSKMSVLVAADGTVQVAGTIVIDESTLATNALQTTGNSSLSSIDTKLSSQATATNQTTGNTSLSSIDGKLPAAAAPADAATNAENATSIRARMSGYNGTTWDRIRQGVTAIGSTFTGFMNVLPIALYNSTPGTRTTGQGGTLEADATGNLRSAEQFGAAAEDNTALLMWVAGRASSTATGAWTGYESGTTKIGTAGINVKASAGRLRRLSAENASTSATYWLVAVNKASAPVANDAVVASTILPPQLAATIPQPVIAMDFGIDGKYFSTGISYAISTTPEKVTLGSADCHVWGDYL
jgi:hypothetical protein